MDREHGWARLESRAGAAGDVPVDESLMVVRVMQQGLTLALSDDPKLRACAADGYTVMLYARVAHEGWKAHLAAIPKRDPAD